MRLIDLLFDTKKLEIAVSYPDIALNLELSNREILGLGIVLKLLKD